MQGEPAGQFLLATLPPSLAQRRLAIAIVLTLLAAFVVAAPFRAIQLPKSGAFITAFQTVLFVNDLMTATLLFAQFSMLRWQALLALASGYLFTALIAIPYALTFPGSFSETGLFGAGYQTAGWLYLIWHCGLPLAVISYALLKRTDRAARLYQGSTPVAIGFSVAIVTALVCGLTWAVIAGDDALPWLFLDAVRISAFGQYVAAGVGLLSALALALLWLRWRSVLDLWLMVVLCAWLLEIGFFVLLTALRFSLAFYASRMFALVTASVVLLVLLTETVTLYGRLARSVTLQRREREARLMAMNAMSASIAHELRQPLAAMMANSDAALLWLAKAPPDLTRVRAAVERITDDGHRANGVVTSLRALFQNENPERQFRDVNRLVRDVLAIEGEELQRNRISVKLELAEPGAQVLCDRTPVAPGHPEPGGQCRGGDEPSDGPCARAARQIRSSRAGCADYDCGLRTGYRPGECRSNIRAILFDKITGHGAGPVDLSDDHRKPQWSTDGIARRRPWGGISGRFARQEGTRRMRSEREQPLFRGVDT